MVGRTPPARAAAGVAWRRWVWVYVAAGVAISAVHWRIEPPGLAATVWDLVAVVAVVLAWVGIHLNRPNDATAWRLLAVGLTLLAAGDVAWDVAVYVLHLGESVPVSDILYLSAYPFLALGLVLIARHRATREALVDGSVVALVIAAPLWQLVIRPTIESTEGSTFDQIVTIAYPVLDCALVVAVAYTVFSMGRWRASSTLLVAGVLCTLAGDIIYARLASEGQLGSSEWLDPIWPIAYTLLAAAALHPSMRALTEPAPEERREHLDRARVTLLACSLFAVPVMLAIDAQLDQPESASLLAVCSVLIAGLVGWRLVLLVRESDRAHDELASREVERSRAQVLDQAANRTLEAIARGAPLDATLRELLRSTEAQLVDGTCTLTYFNDHGNELEIGVHDRTSTPPSWCVPVHGSDSGRVGTINVHREDDQEPSAADVAHVEHVAALAAVAIDRAGAEDKLQHQAFHDPLTGLPNRALLLDRLAQAILRLSRSSGDVAVLFLDVDRFKVINDSLGHDAGDELLVEIAERIERALQAADTVARFGGDEFVVVCEGLHGTEDARTVAERLERAVKEPFQLAHGGTVVVTSSIGIALARGRLDRPEVLLRDADAAMYRAKDRGRARIEVFDSVLRSRVVVRLETERALRRALEREQLRVLFQPVVRLADDALVGAEALLRWRHPRQGLIGPDEFIDIAEETGLIVPIGMWVIEQACDELARESIVHPSDTAIVSVNLSGRQLAQPDLVESLREQLERTRIDPARLCLEVTESVLLDDVESSSATLRDLKELGVLLAVDDFGTGYSSLGYLKQFPFDVLKIDQAFIAGLGSSDADDAIVLAAVQMAHALDMLVVAEGIETERQHARARDLGCDFAQGFLFAPPVAADTAFERLPLRAVSS